MVSDTFLLMYWKSINTSFVNTFCEKYQSLKKILTSGFILPVQNNFYSYSYYSITLALEKKLANIFTRRWKSNICQIFLEENKDCCMMCFICFFPREILFEWQYVSVGFTIAYFAWFCPICVFLQNKAWRRQIWNFANGMMGLMFISDFAKISNEKIFYVVQSYSAPKPNRPKTIENLRSIKHK